MEGLSELLRLQEIDSAIDTLRHQRESIPEIADLEAAKELLGDAELLRDESQKMKDVASAEMKGLDDQAASLTGRIAEINTKLYGGAVKATRELVALQADMEMLERQKTEIEESELEAMVALELAEGELADAVSRVESTKAAIAGATERLESRRREIDALIAGREADREIEASAVPDGSPLELYDRLRMKPGGVVISRLHDGVCGACRLKISSVAYEALKSSSDIPRCEHCSMIAVP